MSATCGHCGQQFDPSSLDDVRYHHNVPHRPIAATGIRGVEVTEQSRMAESIREAAMLLESLPDGDCRPGLIAELYAAADHIAAPV